MRKFCLVVLFNAQGALPGNFPPARLLSQHSRIGRSWLVGDLGLHCGLLLWRSSGGNLGFQKAESGGWQTFGLFVGRPRFPQTCSGSRHSQQAREIHPSCMSTRPSERDCDSDGSWEFVKVSRWSSPHPRDLPLFICWIRKACLLWVIGNLVIVSLGLLSLGERIACPLLAPHINLLVIHFLWPPIFTWCCTTPLEIGPRSLNLWQGFTTTSGGIRKEGSFLC